MDAKVPMRLGELLIHLGILTEADLSEASNVAVDLGLPLGRALVMSDYISDAQLRATITAQSLLGDNLVDFDAVAKAMKLIGDSEMTLNEALSKIGVAKKEPVKSNRLGDLMVEAGVLSQTDVEAGLKQADSEGIPLGRALGAMGKITPNVLHAALNAQVLLRDKRITREQSINALKSAFAKQTSLEQELAEQGSYTPPSGARVRIGEIYVLAGIITEEDVLNSLEKCLLHQKMMGEALIENNSITSELLQVGLRLQEAIDTRSLEPGAAVEVLKLVHKKNISIERALAEMGLLKPPSAERIRIGEILVIANLITQAQLDEAVQTATQNNTLIGKIFLSMGAVGKNTLHNALRCQFMMREGYLNEEQAISLLLHCQHKQIPVDEALGENAARVDLSSVAPKPVKRTGKLADLMP